MHIIVTGLAFGDEGKGSIVDYLARKVSNPLVVRHNGGCQAAHNVVTPDGKHHTFAQFGAGTLAGAPTHLSQFTVINPANLVDEALHLASIGVHDPFSGLTIHEDALIITPYHILANRMREDARGDGRHGSTGQGIGETVEGAMRFPESAIRMSDLETLHYGSYQRLREKLGFWRGVKTVEMQELGLDIRGTIFDDPSDQFIERTVGNLINMARELKVVNSSWLERAFDDHTVIFEGAQGVLLDERIGFHPHTTWSKTTPHNARLLLNGREAYSLGVTRSYTTRHGAGPFPTDLGSLGEAMFPEHHNGTGEYQGAFRRGGFDLLAVKYGVVSMAQAGHHINGIAVTHMGRMAEGMPVCVGYRGHVERRDRFGTPYKQPTWESEIPTFRDVGYDEPHIKAQLVATDTVTDVEPQYDHHTASSLSTLLEYELRAEIVIQSWGPTYEDKKDYMPHKIVEGLYAHV